MGKALVLGGGGVAGIAWETGVLLGLARAGVDLTDADLLVGTSAGATVAAQVATGLTLDQLFDVQVSGGGAERALELDPGSLAAAFAEAYAGGGDAQDIRRRLGAFALAADTPSEAERRVVVEARLPIREWPERALRITAVDAHTGEFVVFDRTSGVELVAAVAASGAVPGVWPAVTIGERRFIDGGMRSAVNVDLATGFERVVLVAPITAGFQSDAASECDALRATGAEVVMVAPDEAAVAAFGTNLLDPATRGPSAEAGLAQADAAAAAVAEVWR
jgi:NTE family protein